MADPITPPAPRIESDRTVLVPPTVKNQEGDFTEAQPKGKLRADFRENEFSRVIQQHGKHCVWRKAMLCPCLQQETQQADMNCADCGGSGYVYVDPVDVRAHMAMFDKNTRIFEKFGMWLEGSTMATVEPQYRLGYRDSLELKDALMPFNEYIMKGNRRGLRSKLPAGVDSARYRIVEVVKVMWSNGGIISALEEGSHFSLTDDGWIRWMPLGSSIPDGTAISILYNFHPVYIVLSHPHQTRDDVSGRKSKVDKVISLPIQAALKLDVLLDSNDPLPSTTG